MGLFGKKKEKCPACDRPFENHEEFIEHITIIHPEEQPCPKCKGTMRWVNARAAYERPNSVCGNCGYIERYMDWGNIMGEQGYGKKKKHFYPKLEKNEDTGKWDFKK
jgi:hypothetical protein